MSNEYLRSAESDTERPDPRTPASSPGRERGPRTLALWRALARTRVSCAHLPAHPGKLWRTCRMVVSVRQIEGENPQMEVTEKIQSRILQSMLETATEQWPEVKGMSPGYVLRFAFVLALTGDRKQAFAATIDRRTTRQQKRDVI